MKHKRAFAAAGALLGGAPGGARFYRVPVLT